MPCPFTITITTAAVVTAAVTAVVVSNGIHHSVSQLQFHVSSSH
jgi:hypothetical protein